MTDPSGLRMGRESAIRLTGRGGLLLGNRGGRFIRGDVRISRSPANLSGNTILSRLPGQ